MITLLLGLLLTIQAHEVPQSSPVREFFKEDHYTGADYLALDSSGAYELVGREHMGVWILEKGRWTRDGETLTFTRDDKNKAPYRGVWLTHKNYVFLVWDTDEAAGIVVPPEQVRRDLDKGDGLPPYVFFRTTEAVFQRETGSTYPFRYYPEMNDPTQKPRTEGP